MSKQVKFFITDFRGFYEEVNKPIRNKEDIIRILLLSIKGLLLKDEIGNEDKGEANIVIEKSSRIYFTCKRPNELPEKYYSFVFPFFLEEDDQGKWNVKCKTSQEFIDSELVDYLLVLLEKGWFSDENINLDDIDKFACDYLSVVEEYYSAKNINKEQKEDIGVWHWSIIKNLLTFEPGYIRYDYDPDPSRENEYTHPLNHLDVYYNTNGTFKLGFDKAIKIKDRLDFNIFKDILDNGKSRSGTCYKLK